MLTNQYCATSYAIQNILRIVINNHIIFNKTL